MGNNKIAWYSILDEREKSELIGWIRDGSTSYEDIAQMYGRKPYDIGNFASSMGIVRRPRGSKNKEPEINLTDLKSIDRKLEESLKKIEDEKRLIEELKAKRAELSVRFEWDDSDVLVFGIKAGQPMRASAREWIQFLNLEGARKLREFIANRSIV
jgi:hypothetical protein